VSCDNDNPNANGRPAREVGIETRTTGSQAQSCRHCGRPIRGRRRNGFCSDRCRMRVRREKDAARIDDLLRQVEDGVGALREELIGEQVKR
jgi:hypothetical protein